MQHISRLAVILAVLALTGCGAPDAPLTGDDTAQATNPASPAPPTSVEPQATTELTPTAELAPTSLPAPTAVPTTTAALTPTAVMPTNVIGSPPDPLATIWVASGSEQCRVPRSPVQTIAGTELLYVDPAGTVYADPRPLLDVIERPGQPPLLITCPLSDTLAVIDPLTERRIELDLPNSTYIEQTALSPDGRLLAMIVYPTTEQAPADWAPLRLLDLETGSMRALVEQETIAEMQDGYGAHLLGWAGGKLYVHQQYSGTATFWMVDPAEQAERRHPIDVPGYTALWSFLPQNQAFISSYQTYPPTQKLIELPATWLDPTTGQSVPFSAPTGLESPDGAAVALSGGTLMLYDVQTRQLRRVDLPFEPWISTYWLDSASGWSWSPDGEELLVIEEGSAEAFLNAAIVRRDGTLRTTVSWESAGGQLIGAPKLINDGNLLGFAYANGGVVLRRIDTHATPFAISDLEIPETGDIVYVPAP